MKPKTARRFLARNSHEIAKREEKRRFGWVPTNSFDQSVIKAKEALGIKRTIPELLRKRFSLRG